MKKVLVLLMALLCAGLALTGCGGGKTLEEPPALRVTCGDSSAAAWRGTCSWQWGDRGMEADSLHPLEAKEFMEPLVVIPGDRVAELNFNLAPDEVTIRCWSDRHWNDPAAEGEELPVEDLSFAMKDGSYIYMVTAEWTTTEDCGGSACYAFYTVLTP